MFPKTKRPKIFSKTLVLHNGGLNLVFKTFFDLNFPKKFLIIPQFQHSQVGQLGPPFFLFFSLGGGGGGGYSPGHGKTSGEVVWLGCGKSDGRAWQVRNCYSINLSWVCHCHTLQPGPGAGCSNPYRLT